MSNALRASLEKFVPVTNDEYQSFASHLKLATYQKHDFLLREGEVCKNAIFIEKGCMRYFFTVHGEEKIGQFFFENSWYTDLESFLTDEPSEQNIQALEPMEVWLMSKKSLYNLYDSSKTFERFGRLLVEHGFLGIRKKNKMLTNLSPEERYLDLIKTRPKVVERISQQHIASYLGIQPESLSRIRKRIHSQGK